MRNPEYHVVQSRKKGCVQPLLGGLLSVSAFAAALWGAWTHGVEASNDRMQSTGTPTAFQPMEVCDLGLETHRPVDVALENIFYPSGILDSIPVHQEGRAHYYGGGEPLNEFTSSGERFDPNALTAASWFYPLGSRVRVTDLVDQESIVVRINDRGPNMIDRPDVIIDLSRGAMQALEPGAGSLMVSVEPVCGE